MCWTECRQDGDQAALRGGFSLCPRRHVLKRHTRNQKRPSNAGVPSTRVKSNRENIGGNTMFRVFRVKKKFVPGKVWRCTSMFRVFRVFTTRTYMCEDFSLCCIAAYGSKPTIRQRARTRISYRVCCDPEHPEHPEHRRSTMVGTRNSTRNNPEHVNIERTDTRNSSRWWCG